MLPHRRALTPFQVNGGIGPLVGVCSFAKQLMQRSDFRSHTNCHTKSPCSIEEIFD